MPHGLVNYGRGEVLSPILSVVSMGTRVPLRNKLRRLNQAMVAMYLRVIVGPNLLSNDCNREANECICHVLSGCTNESVGNLVDKAYAYLKTLPHFSEAEDC